MSQNTSKDLLKKLNIIVYNMNWLGDILFSLPSLEALKKTYPHSHLACVVPHGYDDLLEPVADEVIAISDTGLWGKLETLFRIRKTRWDIGFLFHRSKSRAQILKLARVKKRIGYAAKNREHLLTTSYPEPPQAIHKMDYITQLLTAYGIKNIPQTYRYSAPKLTLPLPKPYVVFHPGSNWEPKRWPTTHYAELGNLLSTDRSVVITGTSQDHPLAKDIKMRMKRSIIDLTGQTTLKELSSVCREASVVIAGDTGPMHLAAASGAHVIALYGPTSPELNGPRNQEKSKVIWENPGCKSYPCHDIHCKHDLSLSKISPQRVYEKILE